MLPSRHRNQNDAGWHFDNSYARLPHEFFARLPPVPVRSPRLVAFNPALAQFLGLNPRVLEGPDGPEVFAGNRIPEGADPIATAYAGHQFGHFTLLGDGRALLLGEQVTPAGKRFDVQLKGSGRTPFSRQGDGRAALGPMLREYIVSEAMHALGIPTTRSLAVATTGESVLRETALEGAVLTRVAASHLRVGTFEYAARLGDLQRVRSLADYTIGRHFPELAATDDPYLGLLRAVAERQASLVARWLHVGFVHGVMNTDNMSLCGETIDYGPCAFMDAYDPATVFSSIDSLGRYAYGNQPQIAQWNLARFAETLLPLLHADRQPAVALAEKAITAFADAFRRQWLAGMRAKLGLFTEEAGDEGLASGLLTLMHRHGADHTLAFRGLVSEAPPDAPFFHEPQVEAWLRRWKARLMRQPESLDASRERMRAHNPAVIARNHLVEEALEAAVAHHDLKPMDRLLEVLAHPYQDPPQNAGYHRPPPPSPVPYRTFCGT